MYIIWFRIQLGSGPSSKTFGITVDFLQTQKPANGQELTQESNHFPDQLRALCRQYSVICIILSTLMFSNISVKNTCTNQRISENVVLMHFLCLKSLSIPIRVILIEKNLKDSQCKKTCRIENKLSVSFLMAGREEKTHHVSDTSYTPNIPPQEGPFVWTKHFGCIIRTMHVPHLSACVQQQHLQRVSTLTVLHKTEHGKF